MKYEKINLRMVILTLTLFALGSLVSCGGSDDKDDDTGGGLNSGRFLDSAVEGLNYVSGSKSGLTDLNGTFQVDGTVVQFSIGDIVLGEGTAKSVMTPIDLVPGATDETDPSVTNITRFLLSLDNDADPSNGIQIIQEVRDVAVGKSIDFSQSTALFETDASVQAIIGDLTTLTSAGRRNLVSVLDAQEHLSNTLLGIKSFDLKITKTGNGSGAVTSSPGGINCGLECSKLYAGNANITLTAIPSTGSTFEGWSGNPDCTDGVVTMTANMTCTAIFNLPPPVGSHIFTIAKDGTGNGTVTSAPSGIDCGEICFAPFGNGTEVTLTPIPAEGSTFSGWSGAPDCADGVVTMSSAKNCTANFNSATNLLIGSWLGTPADGDSVLTFLDDSNYVLADGEVTNADCLGGIERGTYTWNSETGAFNAIALTNTNGDCGFGEGPPGFFTISVTGNTMTLADIEGFSATANKVMPSSSNPLVGGWLRGIAGAKESDVLTFLDDSNYMIASDGVITDGDGQPGMERGTYTWNSTTGAFTVNAIDDTNGAWGLLPPDGHGTLLLDGNTLTFPEGVDGPEVFTRTQ